MGYVVHLVRTEQWFDSETDPVTKENVDKIVAADATLSWSESDYVEMTEDDGSVNRYYLINWNGEPVFWWYKSEIQCKNPNEAQLLKLVEMATALKAKVVGDDGERYECGKTIFGKPKLVIRREEA
jgi:hypothetical protein